MAILTLEMAMEFLWFEKSDLSKRVLKKWRSEPHRGNGDLRNEKRTKPHRGNCDLNPRNGDPVSLVRKKRSEQKSRPKSRIKPPNADFLKRKLGRKAGLPLLPLQFLNRCNRSNLVTKTPKPPIPIKLIKIIIYNLFYS